MEKNHIKRIKRFCMISSCNREYYAKGYCRLHYARLLQTGSVEKSSSSNQGKICRAPDCYEPARIKGLCPLHYALWAKYRSFVKRKNGAKGAKNGNWRGGVAEYPNHCLLKKNRLIRLAEEDYRCEICGGKADSVFHKDCSKSNHSLENLLVACRSCGLRNARRQKHTSEYIKGKE